MNIPPNTVLQLGKADSSYPFQNIVATNIQGSDYVDGFPTTSTGSSLGQYFHLGIDGQGNKKTDMLNVSGTSQGGFNFWTSNSTDAPILLADITKDGISIVKSTLSPNYNTYTTLLTGPNYIVMNYNPSGPPYNWVRFNMYTIQVGNNTATMSTGVNYNVRYVDTQVITVHTTSDPNSPVIDSTGITSVLLPYGSSPVISSSTTLNDTLVLTDTTITSTLSNTDLSLVDGAISSVLSSTGLITTDSNGYSNLGSYRFFTQNPDSSQTAQFQFNGTTLRDNGAGQTLSLNPYRITNNNDYTNNSSTFSNEYLYINKAGTNTVSILNTPSITLDDATHTAVLSTTQLLFDGSPLIPSGSTGQYLTNNGGSSTTWTTPITQEAPITQLCSPAVYGTAPSLPPQRMFTSTSASNIINNGYDGWYFRNYTAGVNIGWNSGFATTTSTVADLRQLTFSFTSPITTSAPFFTVYTSPPTGPNFFNSRRGYVNTGSITANQPYLYYINFNGYTGVPFKSGHISVALTNSNPAQVGDFASTETLYFWSVGTNTASSANTEELVVSSMSCLMNVSGVLYNQPYIFNNSGVITTPQFSFQGAGTRAITPYDYGTQIATTGNLTITNANLRAKDAQFFFTIVNAKVPNGPINITFTGSAGSTTIQLDVSGQLVLIWTGTYFSL